MRCRAKVERLSPPAHTPESRIAARAAIAAPPSVTLAESVLDWKGPSLERRDWMFFFKGKTKNKKNKDQVLRLVSLTECMPQCAGAGAGRRRPLVRYSPPVLYYSEKEASLRNLTVICTVLGRDAVAGSSLNRLTLEDPHFHPHLSIHPFIHPRPSAVSCRYFLAHLPGSKPFRTNRLPVNLPPGQMPSPTDTEYHSP